MRTLFIFNYYCISNFSRIAISGRDGPPRLATSDGPPCLATSDGPPRLATSDASSLGDKIFRTCGVKERGRVEARRGALSGCGSLRSSGWKLVASRLSEKVP